MHVIETVPLTPDEKEKLLRLLRAGNYLSTAALILGFNPGLFHDWFRRGQKEAAKIERGKKASDREKAFYAFFREVAEASSVAEGRGVALLTQAGEKDWKANLEFLERRYPDRWSKRVSLAVKDELNGALDKLERRLSKPEFLKVLYILADEDFERSDS